MSYQALYRAYRPQTFDKVIGQEAVVKTLQNAIINNKISHAYLFCGPRGTGKTTVARIFAKALNCVNLREDGEPCCECENCKEISESISPDVVEIDAASNNGVDEIRDIRERVKFLPSGAKYKIYIIDEVHMLSTGAFNALLKILEEPPKHVIFVLATTEPQKLPATIISRCQRFEFKPLNVDNISLNLKYVCEKEGVTISDDALELIGEVADGGMRDALSILDQTISYGCKDITVDDVNTITGSINADVMCNLMSYLDAKDVNNALDLVTEFVKEGKEVSKIVNGMLLFCRDLMLYKSVGPKQLNKYIFEKEKFQTLAFKISSTKIIYYIELLCDIQNKIKYTNSPVTYLEIAIIRMASINNDELDVIKRMDELESKLIDNSFSGEITSSSASDQKVNLLDSRLNQIVTELNKFELPTLSKKVEDISQIVAEKINQDQIAASQNQSASSKLLELESEIASKFVDIEAKISSIENGYTLSKDNEDTEEYDGEEINLIKNEIANLKSMVSTSKGSVEYNDSELRNEINELKEKIDNISQEKEESNGEFDIENYDEKIRGFELRLQKLESRPLSYDASSVNIEYDNDEINEMKQDIEELKNQRNNASSQVINRTYDDTEVRNDINNIWNKIDEIANNSSSNEGEDYTDKINDLSNRIDELENKDFSVQSKESNFDISKITNDMEAMNEKIATLEEKQGQGTNPEPVNYVKYRELEVKIAQLEKQIMELTAEKLSPKTKQEKAKPNKGIRTQQMSLFDFIPDENEVAEEEKYESNFGDLEKSEETSYDNALEDKDTSSIEKGGIDFKPDIEEKDEEPVQESFDFEEETDVVDNQAVEDEESFDEEDTTENEVKDEVVEKQPEPAKEEKVTYKNELINQYYDEKNHTEVINKTNSSLVIRNEVVEEKQEQPEIIVLDESDGLDKFAKYDIRDLEKIMYDAYDLNARNDKQRVVEIWNNLLKGVDPQFYSVAELLAEGKIEAVGNREFVLTFRNVSRCSEVMRWSFKSNALKFLRQRLGDAYNYLALPTSIWEEKRAEYLEQYQMGFKKAKLKPFNIPGINVNDLAKENEEEKNETIKKTIGIFGDDIVKVK